MSEGDESLRASDPFGRSDDYGSDDEEKQNRSDSAYQEIVHGVLFRQADVPI